MQTVAFSASSVVNWVCAPMKITSWLTRLPAEAVSAKLRCVGAELATDTLPCCLVT